MKVAIVGAGNVATVFGKAMLKAGHKIVEVSGRNTENAARLAENLNAQFVRSLGELSKTTELALIAITDHNIASVVSQLSGFKGILVHTAGSVSRDVLKDAAARYGVIYPLQTLNRQLEVLPPIPVMIDGNLEEVKQELSRFANTWSSQVAFANDEKRVSTHIAAVMVNNFSNHLFALTEEFCNKEGVDFRILLPLVQQTVSRLSAMPSALLQTGPAARGDIAVIDKHLQLLNRYPQLRNLYLKITESIIIQKREQEMSL